MLRWIARCTSDWIRSGIRARSRPAGALILVLLLRTIDDRRLSIAVRPTGLDASINSIRMFRNTCGNVAMARSSDQPDEMKWARMPAGMSGWCEALSTTMSDTRSLWASAIADASCIPEAGTTSTAFLPIRWVMARIKSVTDWSSTFTDRPVSHRAIAEHLEPVRQQQERQIAAEFRDEDNWFAVAKLSLASEIDRLPGDRHRIDPGSCQHPRPVRKKLHCRCEKIDEIRQSVVGRLARQAKPDCRDALRKRRSGIP